MVGKRARRRDSGRGTARRMKERQLGLHLAGVSKPMLDAMNAESKRRFGLGIGVLVQEEERERLKAESLRAQLSDRIWPARWLAFGLRRTLRHADMEREVWAGRLRDVAAHVADDAPPGEVERWAARR
jgi:hypothetical protein